MTNAENPTKLDKLKKLLALDENDPFTLYAIAQEHAKAGSTDEAVAWYDRCIHADKDYCYAYYHKAKALDDADRTDEACASLRAGMEAAKRTGESHAYAELSEFLDIVE